MADETLEKRAEITLGILRTLHPHEIEGKRYLEIKTEYSCHLSIDEQSAAPKFRIDKNNIEQFLNEAKKYAELMKKAGVKEDEFKISKDKNSDNFSEINIPNFLFRTFQYLASPRIELDKEEKTLKKQIDAISEITKTREEAWQIYLDQIKINLAKENLPKIRAAAIKRIYQVKRVMENEDIPFEKIIEILQ